MSPTWINGVLEYWSIGKSLKSKRSYAFGFSITPLLQYSNWGEAHKFCPLSVAIDYEPLKTDFPLFGVNATNSKNQANSTSTNNVRQKR
jgi:hypothetical protein